MGNACFKNCRCLGCRAPLDEVSVDADRCPRCNVELDAEALWKNRTYPGVIVFPKWITAFGWPLLLMLLGAGIMAASYVGSGQAFMRVPVGMFVTGMIWFMVKLSGADD